jgi:hypothetical protein
VALALAEAPADMTDADRKAAEAVLAQAKPKIGELHFKVKPDGAEIIVDGQSVGTAPIDGPLYVDPGTVEVTARAEGYSGVRASRVVISGGVENFEFNLIRAGKVETPAGANATNIFRGVNMPIFWSGVAATGFFLILGTAFAIESDLKASSSHALEQPGASATCLMMCQPQFDSLQKARVNFAGASLGSFILSTTALVGTGTYWAVMAITSPKSSPTTAPPQPVKAGAFLAPGLAGASLSTTW